MTELKNKVAIITGSTSGIGEAIARMLSSYDVKVVINSVSSIVKGNALAKELKDSIYCQANIGIDDECKKLIEATIDYYGRLDFLN